MSQYFNHNGFNIHYETSPSPVAENIVLVHGNLACRLWWHPLLDHWSRKDSGKGIVLNLDWRGFGKSKGLTSLDEINFDVFADDILALMNHLNLEQAHFVGHSTGGLIATLSGLCSPEKLVSMTLLDSVGPWGLRPELPEEQVYAHFKKMSEDKDYCTQVLAVTIHGAQADNSFFKQLRDEAWACDPVCWQGVIRQLFHFDDRTQQVQSQWSHPTLIVHGELDPVLPLKGSEQMQKIYPGSRLLTLANNGHSCNVEDPQQLSEILLNFWDSLPGN
jgi:3-oxoadipate enol-lactonase